MELTKISLDFKEGRKIDRLTSISHERGLIIAAAEEKSSMAAAERIKNKMAQLGYPAEIRYNPDYMLFREATSPVIVMGNLANSKCVEYLYYKLLCVTDKFYPGNGGYNIRTILNPFGTGFNIIHIGYSDEKGLENATNLFLNKFANPIPCLNEVSYERLPYGEEYVERIRKSPIPEDPGLIRSIHTSFWWLMGYIAYLTGDKEQLGKYLDAWKMLIKESEKNPALGNNTHLYMLSHVESWRMLEHSGMLPDDMRGSMEKSIFSWAESSEGKGYAERNAGDKIPSHNHSMFCGLGLAYAADFFESHYKEISQPDEWRRVADNVFYSFNNGGWKPFCDDSAYSTQVTLPLVCMYSIFDDSHRFLNKDGREAADWLKAIMGQNSFVPSYGDGTLNHPFPAALLRVLSHYYKDGELKYMLDTAPDDRKRLPEIELHRMFDSGVEKTELKKPPLITVVPMDSFIYHANDREEGKKLSATPPEGPIEDCFDKISIRTGWKEEDEFLLLDGLGSNGAHAYSDAMGILDYTSKGITWLVEENCYRWPEPENCSILTITRDGYASDIPGFALLEEKKALDESTIYLRMKSPNNNGADWIREVFLIKGIGVVFNDTVLANTDGEYVASAHFRTPGIAELDGNLMKCDRKNKSGDIYELRLSGYGSGEISQVIDKMTIGDTFFSCGGLEDKDNQYDHGIITAELGREMWEKRYNESSIIVTRLSTNISSVLKKGEAMSVTHLVETAKREDKAINISFKDGGISLELQDRNLFLPVKKYNIPRKEGASATQEQYAGMDIKQDIALQDEIILFKTIDSRNYFAAQKNNNLIYVSNGIIKWEKHLKGKIHDIEYCSEDKGMILAGNGNNSLTAIDMEGNMLWEANTVRIPTIFSNWEKNHPQVLKIKHAFVHSKPIIAAGCGDNHVRIYDLAGKLQRAFYIYATVPDIIEFIDYDGDGEVEVLAAGSEESNQGAFYVHDLHGKPKNNIYVGKWLCIFKSHHILKEGNKLRIALGMNYSENFKIIEVENGETRTVSARSLGGMVSSLCADGENNTYYAGTSKGYVMAFDKTGLFQWSVNVKAAVKSVFYLEGRLIVICRDGHVWTLSADGKITRSDILPGLPSYCEKLPDRIIVSCGCKIFSLY